MQSQFVGERSSVSTVFECCDKAELCAGKASLSFHTFPNVPVQKHTNICYFRIDVCIKCHSDHPPQGCRVFTLLFFFQCHHSLFFLAFQLLQCLQFLHPTPSRPLALSFTLFLFLNFCVLQQPVLLLSFSLVPFIFSHFLHLFVSFSKTQSTLCKSGGVTSHFTLVQCTAFTQLSPVDCSLYSNTPKLNRCTV